MGRPLELRVESWEHFIHHDFSRLRTPPFKTAYISEENPSLIQHLFFLRYYVLHWPLDPQPRSRPKKHSNLREVLRVSISGMPSLIFIHHFTFRRRPHRGMSLHGGS